MRLKFSLRSLIDQQRELPAESLCYQLNYIHFNHDEQEVKYILTESYDIEIKLTLFEQEIISNNHMKQICTKNTVIV